MAAGPSAKGNGGALHDGIAHRPTILLLTAAALLLPWIVEPAAGWRDGPELTDAAWLLGVAHPSGYPLYQAVGWMAQQLPLGDIFLRSHLLSALSTLIAAGLLALLLQELGREAGVVRLPPWLPAAIVGCWLLMPPQIENAVQSEAYAPFAAFTFLILLLLLRFMHRRHPAAYLTAAFLAGVGAGNHVMLGAMLFPLILALSACTTLPAATALALAGVAAGAAGLAVYGYIPPRASRLPLMNWGDAVDWPSFWRLVSDRKDSAAHMPILSPDPAGDGVLLHQLLTAQIDWFGLPGLLCIAAGWVLLLRRMPRRGTMLLSAPLFLLLFFPDWRSGTVLTGALALELAGLAGLALRSLPSDRCHRTPSGAHHTARGGLRLLSAAAATMLLLYHIAAQAIPFAAARGGYAAAEMARMQLLRLPYRATILGGPSWFHLRALHDIEGLRPDISIIGLGSVISPHFFGALHPAQLPLLRLPRDRIPDRAAPPTAQRAQHFIERLIAENRRRTTFFLDLDEEYIDPFIERIFPYRTGVWWGALNTPPSGRFCPALDEGVRTTLAEMLAIEPQLIENPQFGLALERGYFGWIRVAVQRSAPCLVEASRLISWWRRWMGKAEATHTLQRQGHDYWNNTLGVIEARLGHEKAAFRHFSQGYAHGDLGAGLNLARWYAHHGRRKAAIRLAGAIFRRGGDPKALYLLRRLTRRTHPDR